MAKEKKKTKKRPKIVKKIARVLWKLHEQCRTFHSQPKSKQAEIYASVTLLADKASELRRKIVLPRPMLPSPFPFLPPELMLPPDAFLKHIREQAADPLDADVLNDKSEGD